MTIAWRVPNAYPSLIQMVFLHHEVSNVVAQRAQNSRCTAQHELPVQVQVWHASSYGLRLKLCFWAHTVVSSSVSLLMGLSFIYVGLIILNVSLQVIALSVSLSFFSVHCGRYVVCVNYIQSKWCHLSNKCCVDRNIVIVVSRVWACTRSGWNNH